MLQSVLAIAADVVDDRLRAAGEGQSSTIVAFLLLSNAAGDGEERVCDLAGIAAGALGLAMNLSQRAGVKRQCVQRKARIGGERIPAIAETTRTLASAFGLSPNPNG